MLIFITSSNLPCLENESQTCLACFMGEKNRKISAKSTSASPSSGGALLYMCSSKAGGQNSGERNMKLKSSWNLAGWNLLNIITLRKRGEIQPNKNIDGQTKFGFSEKSSTCCGRGLFSHGSFPLFGILDWLCQALHMAVPAGNYRDFSTIQKWQVFFDRKNSHVAVHFKVDEEIAVVFLFEEISCWRNSTYPTF